MPERDAEKVYKLGLWAMLVTGLAVLSVLAMGEWGSALAIALGFTMTGWTTSNMAWLRLAREHYLQPGGFPYIGFD